MKFSENKIGSKTNICFGVAKALCYCCLGSERLSVILDKFSVLLLSSKNFDIIEFIMIPRFSIYSILLILLEICLHWRRCILYIMTKLHGIIPPQVLNIYGEYIKFTKLNSISNTSLLTIRY